MSAILCAIRGGPGSKPTIARAIGLAKETDLPLHFLYVVNLDFLAHSASSRVKIISQEMHQMGEFILLAASAQASEKGIQAEGHVRHGTIRSEVIALCQELEASYLVLGLPSDDQEHRFFDLERLRKFAADIAGETGVQVVLPEEDEA